MYKINPYRPGAGACREHILLEEIVISIILTKCLALTLNIPTQSVIFSGLRGVGKTVLINKLQKNAEEKNIFCKHIEIEERNDFISQIANCSQAFLRKVSVKEKFKNLIQKPLDAIKSLVVSLIQQEYIFLSLCRKRIISINKLTQRPNRCFYFHR